MAELKYNKQKEKKDRMKLHEIKQLLPKYTYDFLDEKADQNANTGVAYARDLYTFFEYLKEYNPSLSNHTIAEIPFETLEALHYQDINEYQHYLDEAHPEVSGTKEHANGKAGIARRMSALRGFYEYECRQGFLKHDPCTQATRIRVKTDDHVIIRMTPSEVKAFLELVKSGNVGSEHQRKILQKTKERDYAILTLLLSTGIRVSECVGLDVDDINFKENSMRVFRKGHKEQFLYFSDKESEILKEYIDIYRKLYVQSDDEKALFLSSQKKRLAVRSVQQMVKKYAEVSVTNKKISPHKMRSTYGTALYKQTGDIRLVADVLGHSDINTTSKHYAALEDEHRRRAAEIDPYA